MDKALRGQGCIMKRQKKSGGGAMRDMPENLKEYLEDKKVNKNVDQKKRSIDNLRSIIEDKTILINREKLRRTPKHK
jgi:NADH:ubiquinone oxidoreductase subunit D